MKRIGMKKNFKQPVADTKIKNDKVKSATDTLPKGRKRNAKI